MYQKILTLGPATNSKEKIQELLSVATSFRLNIAHLSAISLRDMLKELNNTFAEANKIIPVILDLQGAKVRIGRINSFESLPEKVALVCSDYSDIPSEIPISFNSVFDKTRVGDKLYLNDRKVTLGVHAIADSKIHCNVLSNGPLSTGKGLNSPDRVFEIAQVAPFDAEAISIGLEFPFVNFAVSFVRDGSEAKLFRPLISERKLIAKIEQIQAFEALSKIDDCFDELWLCRGDLGAEVGFNELGLYQEKYVSHFNRLTKPQILAGEVLGSMMNQPQPSRSEISHLYSMLKAGFDGIVLSDETACGKYISDVVKFLKEFNPTLD